MYLTVPHVTLQSIGKLNVLPVRMNPDLAMGDELLKKTGSGNPPTAEAVVGFIAQYVTVPDFFLEVVRSDLNRL